MRRISVIVTAALSLALFFGTVSPQAANATASKTTSTAHVSEAQLPVKRVRVTLVRDYPSLTVHKRTSCLRDSTWSTTACDPSVYGNIVRQGGCFVLHAHGGTLVPAYSHKQYEKSNVYLVRQTQYYGGSLPAKRPAGENWWYLVYVRAVLRR